MRSARATTAWPVLPALLTVLAACAPAAAQNTSNPLPTPHTMAEPEPATLDVTGMAQVRIPADRARISFSVETEGKTAAEAAQANAALMETAMAALRSAGGTGLTLSTHGYSLQPNYGRPEPGTDMPRIQGYRATNTLLATTLDVDGVGALIDAATGAGVNRIQSLVFDAQDTEAARSEALANAVAAARRQATVIAAALGVPLGRAVRVNGGAQLPTPRPEMAMRAMAMDAMANTPIEAGETVVTAQVSITYELGHDSP